MLRHDFSMNDKKNSLSVRELEIALLVLQGYKNREIADKLFIAERTVKNHLYKIFKKVGVANRLELAIYCVQKRLHLSTEPALLSRSFVEPAARIARELAGQLVEEAHRH